jgi:hypothetical protein
MMTLDTILLKYPAIDKIDFLSVDVEGTEVDVMKGFDIQATEEDAKNYAPYTKSHTLNISLTKYNEKYQKYYLART